MARRRSHLRLRSLVVLIGGALLLAGINGVAPQAYAQESCPGAPEDRYRVNVRSETPPPRLNRSLSRVEIGLMATHGPTDNILGLHTTSANMEYAADYAVKPYGDAYCFWVRGVDVLLRYETPDVYVAKEYRPGSCNYKAILAHEMEHVKVARDYLKRHVPRLRFALSSLLIPKPRSAILVDSPEEAKREVGALFQKLIHPVYEEFLRAMGEAQAKVDAPREYKKVRRRCKKW